MSWEDVQAVIGNTMAIPGNIVGALTGGVAKGIQPIVGNQNLQSLLRTVGPAYAAGRSGDPMVAQQMRANQALADQQQKTMRYQAKVSEGLDRIFPGGYHWETGLAFDIMNPAHQQDFMRIQFESGGTQADIMRAVDSLTKFNQSRATPPNVSVQTVIGPDGRPRQVNYNPVTGQVTPITAAGQAPAPVDGQQPPAGGVWGGAPNPKQAEAAAVLQDWTGSPRAKKLEEMSRQMRMVDTAYYDALVSGNVTSFLVAISGLAKTLDPDGVIRDSDAQMIIALQSKMSAWQQMLETGAEGKISKDMIEKGIMTDIRNQMRNVSIAQAEAGLDHYQAVAARYQRWVLANDRSDTFKISDLRDNPQDLIDYVRGRPDFVSNRTEDRTGALPGGRERLDKAPR